MHIAILALLGFIASETLALASASPIIKAIEWAPTNTILRLARGSDNWPMTWADDDAHYTAYGDGQGFEPFVPQKLSLGLARIFGNPPDFTALNLRAPTLEQKGDGTAGRKASGLLCLNRVLYLWARNAGNSQLTWSADHGATWNWSTWKFTNSFGCPTFLNFGRNYSGAHDDFVYVYSQDSDSAYQLARRYVLARVPRQRILERDAYELFVKLDVNDQPLWSKDIMDRGAVLSSPAENSPDCYRAGVTYNAGLKRYLLVQPVPVAASKDAQGKIDTRFRAGLAVYDAPEPWGPWTTAFFTNEWDVGPGDSASFPTKWMSSDGQTLHLVFSGSDCFSVRKATLRTTTDPAKRAALDSGVTLAVDWPLAGPRKREP